MYKHILTLASIHKKKQIARENEGIKKRWQVISQNLPNEITFFL